KRNCCRVPSGARRKAGRRQRAAWQQIRYWAAPDFPGTWYARAAVACAVSAHQQPSKRWPSAEHSEHYVAPGPLDSFLSTTDGGYGDTLRGAYEISPKSTAADFVFYRLGDYLLLRSLWSSFGTEEVFGGSTKGEPRSCCHHFQCLRPLLRSVGSVCR